MPAQRKYPEELRERAVKMVFEVRDRGREGPGRDRPGGRQLGFTPRRCAGGSGRRRSTAAGI
jgi:hypothetical protein